MPPLPIISGSRRFLLSCLWLSITPVRSFSSMPVFTRRRLAETTVSIMSSNFHHRSDETTITTRRTRRRLLTALEASVESGGEGTKKVVKEKSVVEMLKVEETTTTSTSTPPSRAKKPVAKPPRGATKARSPLSSPPPKRAPPKDWEPIYALVEELRQDRTAPVDSDGSEALPETIHGEKTFRFQTLIALMLSSQTKDGTVGETVRALQEHGLTVENISQTSPEMLDSLIRKVGFHNNKTKYIKQTVEILKEKYDGDIPPNAVEMMKLPGVGPKMAYIAENVAWNMCTGIGVDTHMHRMFNELNWVSSKNPEETRKQLESWLPEDRWPTVNLLWVGFGQECQQFKPKVIRKALECSRPADALRLLKRLGVDLKKEGAKIGMEEEIKQAMKE